MSAHRLTRRSLLASVAGVAAGGLLRPGRALAALDPSPAPVLEGRWVGALSSRPRTVELAGVADLLGVEWQGPARARVELRFRDGEGSWSRWVSAASHGHGPDEPESPARRVGDPVWTGGATAVQLRCAPALSGVRLHLVDVSAGVGARAMAMRIGALAHGAALEQATPVLDAGPGQPPIIARRAWARGMAPPSVAPAYGAVRMAFVHHTENPNGYSPGEVPAMLLAIYAFHRYVNGWDDIGYNFVVDLYGRIFEARAGGIDEPVVGAHAGGYNYASSGVAVLGSFMSVPVSAPARRALERLLAWKLSLHGVPAEGSLTVRVSAAGARFSRFPANARVPLPRVAGHRDGDSTDCPGNVLYGELPGIRSGVRRLAPRPARATLALAAPAPAGEQGAAAPTTGAPTAQGPTLAGTLRFLDGTPIAGAPIVLQARAVSRRGEVVSERTVAEVTSDPQGQWSLPATFATGRSGLWLRALCTGAPGTGAVLSDPLHVRLSSPVSPPVAPAPGSTAPVPTSPGPAQAPSS